MDGLWQGTKRVAGKTGRLAGQALGPLSAVFDVMSLMNRDREGQDQARQLAKQFVDAGYTQGYDSIMAIAQQNPILESQIGDIGSSDYTKTLAGAGLQVGDFVAGGPLGLVTAPIGAAAQIDMQFKKGRRSQAFKEAYEQELIERGIMPT
jgi:hypothetical protein